MSDPLDPRAIEAQDPRLSALARMGEMERRLTNLERLVRSTVPTYTAATLPAYGSVRPGTIVYVSDAAAGSRFQGAHTDGWKALG